jgi:hypothetical protein
MQVSLGKELILKSIPWKKPELVVLSRSKPEEHVLGACKVAGSALGAGAFNLGCYNSPFPCTDCSAIASS